MCYFAALSDDSSTVLETTDTQIISTNTEPSQNMESSLPSTTTKTETTSSEITTVLGTTDSPLTTTDTTKSTTAVEVAVNSSVQCTCVCVEVNMTLEESIEKRKKELQVNVDELSSTKRKLTSVDDPRPSARTVGYVGIVFFALSESEILDRCL